MKSPNLKYIFAFLLSIAMVLSVSACAAGSDGGDDSTAEESEMTEAPAGDIVAAFNFNNKGDKEICELYISQDQSAWGEDQLQGNTIPVGGTYTLTDIPAGVYNVKSVFCEGGEEILPDISISN